MSGLDLGKGLRLAVAVAGLAAGATVADAQETKKKVQRYLLRKEEAPKAMQQILDRLRAIEKRLERLERTPGPRLDRPFRLELTKGGQPFKLELKKSGGPFPAPQKEVALDLSRKVRKDFERALRLKAAPLEAVPARKRTAATRVLRRKAPASREDPLRLVEAVRRGDPGAREKARRLVHALQDALARSGRTVAREPPPPALASAQRRLAMLEDELARMRRELEELTPARAKPGRSRAYRKK